MKLFRVNQKQKVYSSLLFSILIFCSYIFTGSDLVFSQSANLLAQKTYDAGLSVGFVGSGDFNMDFDPYVTKKKSSFLLKSMYDAYLIPKLAVGVYFQVASAPVDMHYTETVTDANYVNQEWVYTTREVKHSHTLGVFVWELGASFKPRFFLGQSWAIKPGLNIGYRKFYFNEGDLRNAEVLEYFEEEDQKPQAEGLGLNGSIELQYQYSNRLLLFSEVGFLTQPYGGTHHVTDLDFGPIFYFLLGAAL